MFKSMLKSVFSPSILLLKNGKRFYQTMSPEAYLYNQRDSQLSREVHEKSLFPLQNSSKNE